jgi:hypothetical protein
MYRGGPSVWGACVCVCLVRVKSIICLRYVYMSLYALCMCSVCILLLCVSTVSVSGVRSLIRLCAPDLTYVYVVYLLSVSVFCVYMYVYLYCPYVSSASVLPCVSSSRRAPACTAFMRAATSHRSLTQGRQTTVQTVGAYNCVLCHGRAPRAYARTGVQGLPHSIIQYTFHFKRTYTPTVSVSNFPHKKN